MKREIIFRGLRTDKNEWVYGDLIHGVGWKKGKMYMLPENINQEGCHHLDGFEVIPESVGQFTGLQDKNGKEIYEGDILGDWTDIDGKMEQSRQAVFWHEVEGQWMLDNSFHQDRSHFFSLAGELRDFEYEIIGNIHENPELTTQCQFKT